MPQIRPEATAGSRPLRIGFRIPFQPGAQSGGNLYDRRLAAALTELGHDALLLETDETPDVEVLIVDELLRTAPPSPPPRIAMVHHLSCDEPEREPDERRRLERIERRFLRGARGILAPSRWTRDRALALRGRPAPAAVIPPGRDALGGGPLPARLPDEDAIERRAREPGPLRVLFLGQLSRRKRIVELIEAVRAVRGCELTIRGDPDPETDVAGRRAEPGELPDLLRSAQLLAVPSSHEGFGLIYLEGFAFGLPAIAARSGGAGDVVAHGENGWLVGSDTDLAALLRRVAGERHLLARMGKAALRTHRGWPVWAESARRAERLIRDVLNR